MILSENGVPQGSIVGTRIKKPIPRPFTLAQFADIGRSCFLSQLIHLLMVSKQKCLFNLFLTCFDSFNVI